MLEPGVFGDFEVFEPGDIVWMIFDGTVAYGAAITRLLHGGDEAELRLAGGARFSEWIGPLDETVTAWARDCGAYRLTMRGRKGWKRFAKRYGWTDLGQADDGLTIFAKDLEGDG